MFPNNNRYNSVKENPVGVSYYVGPYRQAKIMTKQGLTMT